MAVPYTKIITTLPEYKKELGGRKIPSTRIISDVEEYKRYTGGGGGGFKDGGLTPEQARELEAERKRQEAELRRKQEEARKLQEQKQEERKKKIYSGTIGGQVSKMPDVPRRETIQNFGVKKFNAGEIYYEPTLVERQVDTVETSSGKKVPYTNIFYVDPKGKSLGGGAFELTEREATEEEKKYFREQQKTKGAAGRISADKRKKIDVFKETILTKTKPISQNIKETKLGFLPTRKEVFGEYGEVSKEIEESQKRLPKLFRLTSFEKKSSGFIVGGIAEQYEAVREKPMQQAALYGAGVGIGVAVSGISSGVGAIPKVGNILGKTVKVGAVGVGAYLGGTYAVKTIGGVISAPTYEEKGAVFGKSAREVILIGAGYSKGQQLTQQIRGWWATRGREELFVPQGEYPSAPASKQLEMFRKNIYPELGEQAGAFHTTGQKFWKGEIQPQTGSSELAGLYGSTQISTPFARVTGSASKSIPTTKQDLLSMFDIQRKPAVAYLKPEGFRYSPYKKVSPYKIGGQTFTYKFVKSAKKGYADVPLLKREIEAVFRPEAGSYVFESGKYFTRIKGVRVPIDVFGYGGNVPVQSVSTVGILGSGKYSSYNLPSSYPIISPYSLGISYFTQSYKPSYSKVSVPSSRASYKNYYSVAQSYKPSSKVSYGASYPYAPSSTASGVSYPSIPPYAPSSSVLSSSIIPSGSSFMLPKPNIRFKEKSKSLFQIFGQPTKYQPSFTGSILNIRTRVPKNYQRYGFGALRVRGIPTKII